MREGPGSMPGTSTLQQLVATLFSPKQTHHYHQHTHSNHSPHTHTDRHDQRCSIRKLDISNKIPQSRVASRLYMLLAQCHHPTPMSSTRIESNSRGQTFLTPSHISFYFKLLKYLFFFTCVFVSFQLIYATASCF
ncbi:uncharacterized protein DC041_0007440 [Schistosoma bovis]|uniref:Uncharacterized protein n=1 Tax=Schistosoma bovis TaxID=6184 RepID=A0A430QUE6_SCHBO|nr:uncharacterized protein DC041_0007440 [Schistosoma bovis]